MAHRGLDRVCLSVRDLDRGVAFYRDRMELQPGGSAAWAGEEIAALFGLADCPDARLAWLRCPHTATTVELLEFEGARSASLIRDPQRSYDRGLFDMAFSVRELNPLYDRLVAEGLKPLSPPIRYVANFADADVRDVLIAEENVVYLSLIQRFRPPPDPIAGEIGRMLDVAAFVPDMDAAIAFWTEGMGLEARIDVPIEAPEIVELLALPEGAAMRLAFLTVPGSSAPLLELLHCSAPGKPLDPTPPRIGEFAVGLSDDEPDRLVQRAIAAGATKLGSVASTPAGGRRIALKSPDGIQITINEARG
jgi:catechol 2,3-dioxygenase-like lactoylglutathione lyase family enzyme